MTNGCSLNERIDNFRKIILPDLLLLGKIVSNQFIPCKDDVFRILGSDGDLVPPEKWLDLVGRTLGTAGATFLDPEKAHLPLSKLLPEYSNFQPRGFLNAIPDETLGAFGARLKCYAAQALDLLRVYYPNRPGEMPQPVDVGASECSMV